jgi:hypothetical protein
MLVLIEEEFGWKYWRWDYPGTLDELRRDWKAGRIPNGLGYVRTTPGFLGQIAEIDPIAEYWNSLEAKGMTDWLTNADEECVVEELFREWDRFTAGFDARIDIHEDEDTFMRIGGEVLPWLLKE